MKAAERAAHAPRQEPSPAAEPPKAAPAEVDDRKVEAAEQAATPPVEEPPPPAMRAANRRPRRSDSPKRPDNQTHDIDDEAEFRSRGANRSRANLSKRERSKLTNAVVKACAVARPTAVVVEGRVDAGGRVRASNVQVSEGTEPATATCVKKAVSRIRVGVLEPPNEIKPLRILLTPR